MGLVSSRTTTFFSPQFVCVGLLVFINLINYMDRYTISAVLPDIKKFYDIDDTQSGMLNTSFILAFMVRKVSFL